MNEQRPEMDADMEVVDWVGGEGEEMDQEFRNADTVEVGIDSDDDVGQQDSDGDADLVPNENGEVGVLDERDVYSDEELDLHDDAAATVQHQDSVLAVAFSPADRRFLATGGQDDVAVLWWLEEQPSGMKLTQRHRLEGHSDSVVQVEFSHDGAYVATGSYDGTVRIWSPVDGSLVHSLDGPSKEVEWITWHPKGHAILAGSNDTMAWMWWAPTGKLMQIFAGHGQSVTCGCWGLGGKLIVTGSEDQGVIVWNPRAGTPQQHLRQVHESAVISMCSHPEAPIVVTGGEDSEAKVVQIETGKVLASLVGHSDSVEHVGFNNPPAGGVSLLATGSMDGKVLVWDGKTFERRCELNDHFEKGGIVHIKWLKEAQYASWLCTCSTDHTLRLFNALTAQCLRTLSGHSDTVLDLDVALAFAPAAAQQQPGTQAGHQLYVVSGSDDNSCRVFSLALWTAGTAAPAGSVAPAGIVAPVTIGAEASPV